MNKTINDYVFIHPLEADGKEFPYRFILSLSVKIKDNSRTIDNIIRQVEGIDTFEIIGQYSLSITIGRCFSADLVKSTLERLIKDRLFLGDKSPKDKLIIEA